MTAPEAPFTDVTRRGQEAITSAMQTWTEKVQAMVPGDAPGQSGLPSAEQVVDNVFDFAEQLLASQREFAKRVLAAGTEATETATTTAREAGAAMTKNSMPTTTTVAAGTE